MAVPQLGDMHHLPDGGRGYERIVREASSAAAVNVAVTARAALIVTLQAPVPVQPLPLQPAKVALPVGTAVSVTAVPLVYEATHVAPHAMPAGALVTIPLPVPELVTVSAKDGRAAVNVAVTARAALIVTRRSRCRSSRRR